MEAAAIIGIVLCVLYVGAIVLMSGIGVVTRTIRDSKICWLEMIAFGTIFSSLIGEVVR